MMTPSLFLGIDPGKHGAVSLLGAAGEVLSELDTPIIEKVVRKRKPKKVRIFYDEDNMVRILRNYRRQPGSLVCLIELATIHQGQGSATGWQTGFGFGLWRGMLRALNIPYQVVTPQEWRKAMMPRSARSKTDDPLAALRCARRRWGKQGLELKKHEGRADARLIADHARLGGWRDRP